MRNFYLGILILLWLGIFVNTYGQISDEDAKLFHDSLQDAKDRKFNSALLKVQKVLEENPENFEVKTNECSFLLELNRLLEAEKCLEYTISRKSNDAQNLNNLGVLFLLRGEYESAKTQFVIVHQMVPDNITTYANLLAVRTLLNEDIEQILNEHEQLLKQDEFNVQVLSNIVKILNDKKEFGKAKVFLDRVYEIDSTHPDVLTQYGVWYALQGDLVNAEIRFSKALEKSPENIAILNNLGLLHRDLGDKFRDKSHYQKSLEYYNSVLTYDPENAWALSGTEYSSEKLIEIQMQEFFVNISILIAGVIAVVIGLILTAYFRYRYLSKLQELPEDFKIKISRHKQILSSKLTIIVSIGLLMIPLTLIIVSLSYNIPLKEEWDVANWTTMVVEVGIGITVAVLILSYELSKNDETKLELTTEREKKNERLSHEQKELVHIFANIRNVLLKINPKLQTMLQNEKYDYNVIKEDWGFLRIVPLEALNDVLTSSSDILKPDLITQIRVIRGHLRLNLADIVEPLTASIQIEQLLKLITNLLKGDLNESRLKVIDEKTKAMESALEFGKQEGHKEEELESVRLFHEIEIKKFEL